MNKIQKNLVNAVMLCVFFTTHRMSSMYTIKGALFNAIEKNDINACEKELKGSINFVGYLNFSSSRNIFLPYALKKLLKEIRKTYVPEIRRDRAGCTALILGLPSSMITWYALENYYQSTKGFGMLAGIGIMGLSIAIAHFIESKRLSVKECAIDQQVKIIHLLLHNQHGGNKNEAMLILEAVLNAEKYQYLNSPYRLEPDFFCVVIFGEEYWYDAKTYQEKIIPIFSEIKKTLEASIL